MKVIARQLGRSGQRLLYVPAGTTLGLATADTAEDLETEIPPTVSITALGAISSIAQTLFRDNQIGLALKAIFGRWLTILESLTTETGPTWHLIEGPIELPFQPYNVITGVGEDQAILGLGRARL